MLLKRSKLGQSIGLLIPKVFGGEYGDLCVCVCVCVCAGSLKVQNIV